MVNRGDSRSTIRFDLLMTQTFNNKQKVSPKAKDILQNKKWQIPAMITTPWEKYVLVLLLPILSQLCYMLAQTPEVYVPYECPNYHRQSAIRSYSNGPSSSMSTPQLHQKTGSSNNLKHICSTYIKSLTTIEFHCHTH